MAEVASSSSSDESPNVLSFPDCLYGGTVFLTLVPDGILQSPKQLLAPIMDPLKLIKRQKRFFAHHRRQQAPPPLGSIFAECSPCGRVRLMLSCVAFACQRLVTAPADTHMAHMSWSWAEMAMEHVTRGRVKKVQVLLQRRACCAVRCACRANACVRCVFDACVMQETVAGFEVRCCASQRLHQARRDVHSCVQAAAAARVAGGDDILDSARKGDGVSLLCHVIAHADAVNKRGGIL
jgi:hypothetical protein